MDPQVSSAIRTLLKVIGGSTLGVSLLMHIGIDPAQFGVVVDALGTITLAGGVIWSAIAHKKK